MTVVVPLPQTSPLMSDNFVYIGFTLPVSTLPHQCRGHIMVHIRSKPNQLILAPEFTIPCTNVHNSLWFEATPSPWPPLDGALHVVHDGRGSVAPDLTVDELQLFVYRIYLTSPHFTSPMPRSPLDGALHVVHDGRCAVAPDLTVDELQLFVYRIYLTSQHFTSPMPRAYNGSYTV